MTPHPGFGAFAKSHREFFDALGEGSWETVAGYSGVEQKILAGALDPANRSGSITRLVQWQPGAHVGQILSHEWCEEVYVVSGTLAVGVPDRPDEARILIAGTFACRPPNILHGPFFSPGGCLLLEFLYFPPAS